MPQLENGAACDPTPATDPCEQYRAGYSMDNVESSKIYGACPPKTFNLPPHQRPPPRTAENLIDDALRRDGGERTTFPASHAESCFAAYQGKVNDIKKASYCQRCDDPAQICDYPSVNMFDTSARRRNCTKNYDTETCMVSAAPGGERQKTVRFAEDTNIGVEENKDSGRQEQGDEVKENEAAKVKPCNKSDCPKYSIEKPSENQKACPSLDHKGSEQLGTHPRNDDNGVMEEDLLETSPQLDGEEPKYPWRFTTEEYNRVCGIGIPKKNQRNNRALEKEGICPAMPFVKAGSPKTSDYYKTGKLPARFEYPTCFTNFGSQMRPVEHPFYRTTTKDYGWYPPNVHSVPATFMPRSQAFTKAQTVGGMYRNYGLNLLS